MNVRERELLKRIIDAIEHPSVVGSSYDAVTFKRTEIHSIEECDRLLNSVDYKAGWLACAERVREYVAEMERKAARRGGRR